MDVGDVRGIPLEDLANPGPGPGMHRQVAGDPRREPLHLDPVDNLEAGALRRGAGRGRDHPRVITAIRLGDGQATHLSLDAPRAREVAVRDMGNAHAMTLRPWYPCPRRAPCQDVPVTTLVFVHAHPDDEALLTSGTMARAAAEGHRVVLIVATDGSAGLTSGEFRGDLADTRRAEVEQSARHLSVARVVHLGYADSGRDGSAPLGFASAPLHEVSDRIADVAAEESAQVLVGYDPSGGYGHPDHLRVHTAVREVARRVPTARLFEATLPREPITTAVRLAAATRLTPAGFSPSEFAQAWTPRRQITHRVDVTRYLSAKRASLAAHASQAAADDSIRTLAVLNALPDVVFRRLLGTEYYVSVP